MGKIYIDAGHGGSDAGAVKYVKEKDVNLTMALACRDYLVANGQTVKMSRTIDKDMHLNSICNECNNWGADLAISCHNNAGGGDGFEVWHAKNSTKGIALGKAIIEEVGKIGQNSRGMKYRLDTDGTDYFGFNRMINCPSIILEGAFVDNATDVKAIDTITEQKAFGVAYAKGILKYLQGNTGTAPTTKPTTPVTKPTTPTTTPTGMTSKEAVKLGQHWSNVILGTSIPVDGDDGPQTKVNKAKILQWGINSDYGARLVVDGKFEVLSKEALGQHYVRQGETQWMVTAAEILLLMNGYNPHGVERPGTFGSGCATAVAQFQSDAGLVVDKIAGRKTFLELIK